MSLSRDHYNLVGVFIKRFKPMMNSSNYSCRGLMKFIFHIDEFFVLYYIYADR